MAQTSGESIFPITRAKCQAYRACPSLTGEIKRGTRPHPRPSAPGPHFCPPSKRPRTPGKGSANRSNLRDGASALPLRFLIHPTAWKWRSRNFASYLFSDQTGLDNLVLHGQAVGAIDSDLCGLGYYLLDVAARPDLESPACGAFGAHARVVFRGLRARAYLPAGASGASARST